MFHLSESPVNPMLSIRQNRNRFRLITSAFWQHPGFEERVQKIDLPYTLIQRLYALLSSLGC